MHRSTLMMLYRKTNFSRIWRDEYGRRRYHPTKKQVDEAILEEAGTRWMKVAWLVHRVVVNLDQQKIRFSEEHVGPRVRALVAAGKLEGVGDLWLWTRSEVRLSNRGS